MAFSGRIQILRMMEKRHRHTYPLSQVVLRTSTSHRQEKLPKHGLRCDRCFCKNSQQTNNAFVHLKVSHFSFLSSKAGLLGKYLQNLFLNQRPPSVFCFLNRKFTQGNTHIFLSVERLEKYIPFIKKKKKSHLGEGLRRQAGCSRHLTEKYPCYSFPFSFHI